ncbi:hypothetical protein APSETT444_004796 [Aspergillus pseudonomiae]
MTSNLTFPGHPANISQISSAFAIHDNRFLNIIGSAPKLEVLFKNDDVPFAHEASVFIPSTDELFLSSNIFTDPITNHSTIQISKPQLPNQVYRFDPVTKNVRVVADGFGRPNGIAFSSDEKTVYITDTGSTLGDGTNDPTGPSTIYAFDVSILNGEQFLTNRRLFAMADTGVPDGIKLDMDGNVYAGCGDGINVWSPGGVLLGKILIKDGAANFSFGRNGQMFILSENTLWTAQLSRAVKGALLKI